MNVRCPSCETVYRVDPAKVPQAGTRARCTVCSHIIAVPRNGERREAVSAGIATKPGRPTTPPAPAPAAPVPPAARPAAAPPLGRHRRHRPRPRRRRLDRLSTWPGHPRRRRLPLRGHPSLLVRWHRCSTRDRERLSRHRRCPRKSRSPWRPRPRRRRLQRRQFGRSTRSCRRIPVRKRGDWRGRWCPT